MYQLTGKEYQPEIGWSDFGARMYDASIGRWNAIDPLSESMFSWSNYSYNYNNPIIFVDPTGMLPKYNWDTGEYEDDDGNVISFEDAMAAHGIDLNESNSEEENESEQSTSPERVYSRKQYIKLWKKTHGKKMSKTQKKALKRGCIGITAVELGRNINPPLNNTYISFSLAQTEAKRLEADIKNNPYKYPPNSRVIIFSKRFWSDDPNKYLPDRNGKVDMSGYTYDARPCNSSGCFTNFDYGLYNEKNNTWFHANHSEPGMKVYESTLAHYSRNLIDFNRQTFSVAITTEPKSN